MVLQTATADTDRLAKAVSFQLYQRRYRRKQKRALRIADAVTPIVLGELRERGKYWRWGNSGNLPVFPLGLQYTKEEIKTDLSNDVYKALGFWQLILWNWVIPVVVEWIVEWYFSDFGYAMRAKHRVEAE